MVVENEEGRFELRASSRDSESDESLLARVGEGDERALAELHARYGSIVWDFVLSRVEDRGVAEEVNADVWLGCWRSARAFRHGSRVLTWLLGIAKRQIYVRVRRKCLPQVPLDEVTCDIASADPSPVDLVVSFEETASLLAALQELPDDLAEIVRLAWVYELSYPEIAQLVGVPVGTVKSRVFRARGLLIGRLRRDDE